MGLGESLGKKVTKGQAPEKPSAPSRARLTWTNCAPTINDTRLLLAEAEKARGLLCELPIRTPLGTFVLSCQSDHLSNAPCWTLYEGEDGTKQLWSYLTDNVEMIHNIVNMSVLNKDAKTEVDLPPPAPGAEKPAASATSAAAPAALAAEPAPAAPPAATTLDPFAKTPAAEPWPPAPATAGWGNAAPADPSAWTNANPQTGWNAPQNVSPWGAAAQQPVDPFAPAFTPAAQPYTAQPYQQAQSDSPWKVDAAPSAPSSSPSELSEFAHSLDGKKGTTIAELSMSPSLPAACVDAALKLQEMVLKGHFGEDVALLALKYAALNNGDLSDTVLTKAKSELSSNPNEAVRQACALLVTAGMLKEPDIIAAEGQLEKHNNSLSQALISSGKVDSLLLEAAQDCLPLIADAKIRQDQAIIALLYCQRSRAKLKDALEELSIEV